MLIYSGRVPQFVIKRRYRGMYTYFHHRLSGTALSQINLDLQLQLPVIYKATFRGVAFKYVQ